MHKFILSLVAIFVFTSCQSQSNHNCPFPYDNHQPEDKCGFLEVPRNWDTNSSETTKLGYLVIRSKSENRKEDPVIFLQGGPGGSVLNLANIFSQLNIDRDRDFILYDQRGIDFSEELCPDLNLQLLEVMALDLNIDEEITELKKRVISCTNYIKTDDRQFSTITNVKDLEALRKHLGYKQLNLFGGSYGTRLGLKYMEHYPNQVRTAVLSSLFPPDIRMYDNLFSNFNNALDKVFTDCAKDSNCNANYPNLKSEFLSFCDELKSNPITIEINGDDFILNQQDVLLFMHQMLYNNQTIERIPEFIEALKEKNTSYITRTIVGFIPRVTILNLAVYYAVMTADEGGFNNQDKVNLDTTNLMFTDTSLSIFSADPEIIKSWPSVNVKSNPMNTVTSDIPTLLISGDFDPVTPINNGNVVAKRLSNNQHIVFKNNGHVPINSCFFNLAKQFLNNPDEKLKSQCHNTVTKIRWN
ncbi:Probable secreted peptidase of alpha/beta hydrolase superfamily protein [Flavobacteriales bacterium ALC-1]|nr:Probable secreted peptidase of alpha/beta hydrolase superfamily protein [Flavobacteriales bacterium ALC-1]